jgi:hypothetical protein
VCSISKAPPFAKPETKALAITAPKKIPFGPPVPRPAGVPAKGKRKEADPVQEALAELLRQMPG